MSSATDATELTARQCEVLLFIAQAIDRDGYAPTIREISDRFGINLNATAGHLRALRKKGFLERRRKATARSMRVLRLPPEPGGPVPEPQLEWSQVEHAVGLVINHFANAPRPAWAPTYTVDALKRCLALAREREMLLETVVELRANEEGESPCPDSATPTTT